MRLDLLGAAFNLRFWAFHARTRWARRAHRRRRTHDIGASRTRARGALATLLLHVRAGVDYNRPLFGDRTLQNILRHIGHRRALRLKHIVVQIGAARTRRNRRLQNILRHVWHGRTDRCSLVRTMVRTWPVRSAF